MSVRLLTTADADAWNAALAPERSVFGSLGFARAQERAGAGEGRLLVADGVAYPTRFRRLADDLPFSAAISEAVWDATSPPFTGPLVTGAPGPEVAPALAARLRDEGVVAEFAHLHPWRAAPELAGGGEADREIVWVDVTLDPEQLWRESYSKACRKNLKRAEREGVTVRAARDADDIAEFHRIYIQTMERAEALPSYFFDLAHFEAIFEELPAGARFALAEHDGRVVAATLYLHDADVRLLLPRRRRPRLPAPAPDERRRPRDDRLGAGGRQAPPGPRRRLPPGRRDLPLQGELLAASRDPRAGAPRAPAGRLRSARRRVARPPWRRGRRRRVLPALPGDAGVSDQRDFFREVELSYWADAEGLKDEEIALVERYLDPSLPTLDAGTGGGRIPRALLARGFVALTGFDFAPELVAAASAADSNDAIRFDVADATSTALRGRELRPGALPPADRVHDR